MNGAFIPNTPIAVDFWQIRRCSNIKLFFLSHMHSDHTVGLSSTWSHPLYCSPVTAKILKHKLQVKSKWINPLEVGVCHMLPLDDCGIETVSVTLIDANHCPGSVMFLFEGYFGTVLYTGDFRYSPLMLKHPALRNKKVDVLYLDNTNCDPEQKLPSRQEATKQIKEIINDHPSHDIVIGNTVDPQDLPWDMMKRQWIGHQTVKLSDSQDAWGQAPYISNFLLSQISYLVQQELATMNCLYSIGKESLLVDLAKSFNSWVVVSPQRLELLTILETEDVFTTLDGAGRIRVVEQSEVNYASMVKWNCINPTIAILPTSRKVKVWHKDVHVVPYSDHSSYDELIDFVSQLKPCSIIPVVKTQDCMSHFKQYLNHNAAKNYVKIPNSVKAFMKRQHLTSEVCTTKPKVARKPAPRGVEFDTPEKSLGSSQSTVYSTDKQESTPNSTGNGISLEKEHNIDNCFSGLERGQVSKPLTESTLLVSHVNRTPKGSPSSDKTQKSCEYESEMPSAILSSKDMNFTVLSNASFFCKETRTPLTPNVTISSRTSPCMSFNITRADGLSILPFIKRKKFNSSHFHHQVERYLENCIHRMSHGKVI